MITIILIIVDNNNNSNCENNNNNNNKNNNDINYDDSKNNIASSSYELGTCRTRLVCPEQPVLCIPVRSTSLTVWTITQCNIIETRTRAAKSPGLHQTKAFKAIHHLASGKVDLANT